MSRKQGGEHHESNHVGMRGFWQACIAELADIGKIRDRGVHG